MDATGLDYGEQASHEMLSPAAHYLDKLVFNALDRLRDGAEMVKPSRPIGGSGGSRSDQPPVAVIPDDILRQLNEVFRNDSVFEAAIVAVERRMVARLSCPSGRICWTVDSTIDATKGHAAGREEMILASGIREGSYTIVAGMCSCQDYAARVLLARPLQPPQKAGSGQEVQKQGVLPGWRRWCKHNLAAALADALGPTRYRVRLLSDEEMARWMASF